MGGLASSAPLLRTYDILTVPTQGIRLVNVFSLVRWKSSFAQVHPGPKQGIVAQQSLSTTAPDNGHLGRPSILLQPRLCIQQLRRGWHRQHACKRMKREAQLCGHRCKRSRFIPMKTKRRLQQPVVLRHWAPTSPATGHSLQNSHKYVAK
jgi:hypothetical protein